MYRITIDCEGRKVGDVQPNPNEVKRYLYGRVMDYTRPVPEKGTLTYETTLADRGYGLPLLPVTVTIENLRVRG